MEIRQADLERTVNEVNQLCLTIEHYSANRMQYIKRVAQLLRVLLFMRPHSEAFWRAYWREMYPIASPSAGSFPAPVASFEFWNRVDRTVSVFERAAAGRYDQDVLILHCKALREAALTIHPEPKESAPFFLSEKVISIKTFLEHRRRTT